MSRSRTMIVGGMAVLAIAAAGCGSGSSSGGSGGGTAAGGTSGLTAPTANTPVPSAVG
jgi:hypothetical protein